MSRTSKTKTAPIESSAKRDNAGGNGARTKARKSALDVLFQVDLCGMPASEVMEISNAESETGLRPYSVELIEGVTAHLEELDATIAAQLPQNWTLQRMPRVDRVLARIASYEMCCTQLPPAIAIAQAVKLAKELSTDESPAFLNGVLSAIAKDLAQRLKSQSSLEPMQASQRSTESD